MTMASRTLSGYRKFVPVIVAASLGLMLAVCAQAQDSEEQEIGTLSGTVVSPTGKPIEDARVIMTDQNTGKTSSAHTNAQGNFNSGDLAASDYNVHIEARHFVTVSLAVVVKAGAKTTTTVTMAPEPLPGVFPVSTLNTIPLRDPNFTALLQLLPEFQTAATSATAQSTGAPSALEGESFLGRTATAAPVLVDGTEVDDRLSGRPTQNIPVNSIQEFQLGGLLAPIANQFHAPGALNLVTRRGGEDLHGDLFGFYSNGDALSASLPGGHSRDWGRQQYGGDIGGSTDDGKLFFFLSAQRNRMDLTAPVVLGGGFSGLPNSVTTLSQPYREAEGSGRLDYRWSDITSAFYRFAYDQTSNVGALTPAQNLQPILARTNTPSHTFGLDHTSGSWVHSFRFTYLKFRNVTADDYPQVASFSAPRPDFTINIGGGAINNCSSGSLLCLGPSPYANERNYQSNNQFRYDGTRAMGAHQLHVGVNYTRVALGRFAPLYSIAPSLSSQSPVPLPGSVLGSSGNADDPLAYPVQWAFLGNGAGNSSEKNAFGLPGGLTTNQFEIYGADTWIVQPGLALTYGVRWTHGTVPTNSDLPAIAQLNSSQPRLGNSVRNPKLNFAPQVGVAWDPSDSGKTIFRGGIGLFYDASSFLSAYADRPLRLQNGSYLTTPAACVGGTSGRIQWPTLLPVNTIVNGAGIVNADGTVSPYDPVLLRSWCGESIAAAGPMAQALQQAYQGATSGAATNPVFMGNPNSFAGPYQNGHALLAPNYQTPRTVQMNIGMQHEMRPGLTLSVDYTREVTTRTLLGVDVNHGGAAATFNLNNALAARDAAQVANGCPIGNNQVACMVTSLGAEGALQAYGAAGIGGPAQVTGGAACPFCAFPGIHPNLGVAVTNLPEGRSVYKGLNLSLRQQVASFGRGVRKASFEVSYSRSNYVSQGDDSGAGVLATDFSNPDRFTGPGAFDRKNRYSFGAHFDLKHALELSFAGRFYSPLPLTLTLPQMSGGAEVLVTDFTGDGTTGDIVPGGNVGSYMRDVQPSGLQPFFAGYNQLPNSTTPETPAGRALVSSGVFSDQELRLMGGILQPLASSVQNVAGLGWLKTFDVRVGWEHHFGERITVIPSISAFNLLNFANFDVPGNTQNGVLNFGPGSTSPFATALQPQSTAGGISSSRSSRINRASYFGMNAAGAPRAVEFGVKVSF